MAACKGRANYLKPKEIWNTTPNPDPDPLAAGPELFEGQNNGSSRAVTALEVASPPRGLKAGMIAS
jgi:hypothetical protein